MKKNEIKAALDALRKIKMTSIENKELRNSIITDHLKLVREQKRYDEKVQDLETVHLGAFADEREQVAKLQRDLQTEKDTDKQLAIAREIESHTELFEAIRNCNKVIAELGKEEVEIAGIPEADFIEAIQSQDFDLGQIEALVPMFK